MQHHEVFGPLEFIPTKAVNSNRHCSLSCALSLGDNKIPYHVISPSIGRYGGEVQPHTQTNATHLCLENRYKWDDHLPYLMMAYHSTIRYTKVRNELPI